MREPGRRQPRSQAAGARGEQESARGRREGAKENQWHGWQVELEAEEDKDSPGRRAEGGQQIDGEHDSNRDRQLGESRHRRFS